ncbi:MAG: substrate-binding domain-containing protein [Oceanospirillales bacterium]|nr:substrate-binding domain-containing protein [Oceanospirillales bacterium]
MQNTIQGRVCPRLPFGFTLLLVIMLPALLAISTTLRAAGLGDYWSVDQYYSMHPDQKPWLDELVHAVQQDPVGVPAALRQKTIRIAQVYPGLQASSYWSDSENALTGRLDALGIRYWLETRYTAPNTQFDEQIRQIHELLAWKPDYLIYTLDSPRQKLIVERLVQNTDTRLILQNITTPLKAWDKRQPFMYVGFDHAEGAQILAQQFRDRFPDQADYGVLFRSKGLVSQMRGVNFIQAQPAAHRLRSSFYSDSSREGGRVAALQMLRESPQLDYIYACSTDLALGVLDALAELDRQDVMVNGWGGGPEEIEQLRAGSLPLVLMRMSDESGIAIAEAIRRELLGLPVPLVYAGRFTVLHKGMSDASIREQEARAHRYSGVHSNDN